MDPKTNQEVELRTEKLAFNPFKRIKSNKCNVYIYDNKAIAEDFELANNKEERFFKETDGVISKLEKKEMKILVVLAIILLIVGTIVLICSFARNGIGIK